MARTLEVVFDGEVLRPVVPTNELRASAHYEIEIIEEKVPTSVEEGVWDVLRRFEGSIEAPEDWSSEHDHYIHGGPKHRLQGS